jgi:hypothetical protein
VLTRISGEIVGLGAGVIVVVGMIVAVGGICVAAAVGWAGGVSAGPPDWQATNSAIKTIPEYRRIICETLAPIVLKV